MRPKVQSQGETFRKAFSTVPVLHLWQFLCAIRGSAYHGGPVRPSYSQVYRGSRRQVLIAGRCFGSFFRQSMVRQHRTRGLFYNGPGTMDDVGQLRFLLDRLAVVIIIP
jgi:hypothetical protein